MMDEADFIVNGVRVQFEVDRDDSETAPGTHLLALCLDLINAQNHIAEAREHGAPAAEAMWRDRYKLAYDELASLAPEVAASFRRREERA